MKRALKRMALTMLLSLIFIAIVALGWSLLPIESSISQADPTVQFENRRSDATATFKEAYFEYQNLNLHYVETGKADAETIVFLHGFPSYWYSFVRQINSLKSDYRIIAIDGLGAGRSDAPRKSEAYALDNMSLHLGALFEHLKLEKVHLVGHDWGAAFAFAYAQKYPQQVASVTGISAPPQNIMLALLSSNAKQQETFAYVEKLKGANALLLKLFRVSKRVWEGAYAPLVGAGKLSAEEGEQFRQATSDAKRINAHINWYRANVPHYEQISDDDFWPSREARLSMPAMLVWGNTDKVFVPEFIKLLKESSDDLRVLELDEVGHWPHVERAAEVNAAIRALIEKTD